MNNPSQILLFLFIFHQFDAAFSRFHKVYPHHKRFDYQLQSVDLNQMNEIIQQITNLNKLTSSNLTPDKLPNEFDPTTHSISSNPGEMSTYSPTYTQSGSTSSGPKNPTSIPDLNTSNSHSKDKSGEVRSNQTTNSSPNSGVPRTKDCDTLNSDSKESTSVNGKNQTTNTSRKNPIAIPKLNVSKENSKNESLTEDQSDSDNSSEHTTDSLEDSDSSETEQEASGSSNSTNTEDKPSKSSNTSNPRDCDQDQIQDHKAGKIKKIVNTDTSTVEKSKIPTSQNSPQRLPTGSDRLLHHSGNEINPSDQIQSPNEEFGGNHV